MPATPAWPPKSAPRLFIAQELATSEVITLEGKPAHYLGKVMRVAPGDAVILCDNLTGEWATRVVEAGKRAVTLEPVQQLRPRERTPDVWLCPALLKKDRFDLVLEKATELGVARIQPIVTRRCVADKLNPERAQAIVTEAAEQCARTALPEVAPPTSLDALLDQHGNGRTFYFADEMGGEPAARAFAERTAPAAILLGPEGGFDDSERDQLRRHPAVKPISLGPRILRGETAAIAALALWMAVAGDWAASSPVPGSG